MEKLRIFKLNEVFFQVETDDAGIRMELREYFSFYVPNYKWHPKVKAKIWDGRLYVYDVRTSRLPIGLFWDFFNFCDDRDYRIEFIDQEFRQELVPREPDETDVAVLDSIPFVYGHLRDYQMNAVVHAISNRRSIIISPTGSGKSALIYYLSLWYIQKHRRPVLVIVPTVSLVSQMAKDFHAYSKGGLPESFVHQVYSGQEKENIDHKKSPIVISTWQSVIALDQRGRRTAGENGAFRKFLDPFGMVCLDECHLGEAASITRILENTVTSDHRFGFTGTLKDSKTSEMQLRGLLGGVYRTIYTHELQERKELADLSIECHVLKYSDETRRAFSKAKFDYRKEIDFILSVDKRTEYISRLALGLSGNTLILFQFIEKHGKRIFKKLNELRSEETDADRKIFFISGASPVEDRERMREIVEKERNAIICGSSPVLSTGVNIVNLNNVVFAFSTKSQVRVIQSIGRALRVSNTKLEARLYDIVDNLSWRSRRNYTMTHALKRIEYYTEEKFKYSIKEIDFTER